MQFCENCDNILIPRNKRLYCKACDEEFDFETNSKEYNIIKTIVHEDSEISPIIIKEGLKGEKISAQDRKAYEEFFTGSESSSY
jgi:DNA-directed RNA polymerase subunit M/transcription elongation factor TFIIS